MSHYSDNLITITSKSTKKDTGCTDPETKSYDLTQFSGQTVKLRLEVTSSGNIGTIELFGDVQVIAK